MDSIKKHVRYDLEKLLFRRQFILGPSYVEQFTTWRRVNAGNGLCLTVHPDLPTQQATSNNKTITLLGYILDPNDPVATDTEILNHLLSDLSGCDNLDNFFRCTYELGGRWVLIVNDGKKAVLFHDAIGLRQVFYTDPRVCGAVWCASQPGIIAETLGFEMDEEAVNGYMNTDAYKKWDENLWPGDSTPYREIIHLLPNHSLNLTIGTAHRYYPDANLGALSLAEGIELASKILTGLMKSAANRFDLILAMTAGWDTRLILAASREIQHRLWSFTFMTGANKADTTVPRKLLSRLGLRHDLVEYPDQMDGEFERIYKRNVTTAHDRWGRMGQPLYGRYPEDRVCVKGNAGEITRLYFRMPAGEEVTARALAMFSSLYVAPDLTQNPFVLKHWEKWLSETQDLYNFHILDLFYWEHRGGNFSAMAQAEFDILQEGFNPYSCRRLLTTMLSVDEKYRKGAHRMGDQPVLYREIILKLWPEILSEPINPPYSPPIGERIKNGMRQAVMRRSHWGHWLPKRIRKLARSLVEGNI